MGGDSEKGSPAERPLDQTARDALLQLALRCEREEPTIELRIALGEAIGWRKEAILKVRSDDYFLMVDPQGRKMLPEEMPAWESSLDAAVTLVPADCWRETNGPRRYLHIPSPSPNYWKAEVTTWAPEYAMHMGWAATEPMAICAASLRACAAMATDEPAARTSERSEAQP